MGQTQLPAPVGGINLRDGLAMMKATDALIMDNWVPESSYLQQRRGYSSHATGLAATPRTLMAWNGPTSSQMFSASGANIHNVTSAGAVGTAVVGSRNSAEFSHVNFTTAGGHWLVLANGVDAVAIYNGTAWTSPTITGVASSTLKAVHSHKSRLWFIEGDSTNLWYLEPQSIAGTANVVSVGEQLTQGGNLVAIGSISRDGGKGGSDDLLAVISSKGEVVVYEGDDPTDASTWQRLGTFYASPPVGRKCFVQVGGDLGILTESGLLSARQLLMSDQSSAERTSITNKVNRGIKEAFRTYGTLAGWQVINYPRGHLLILNVPTSTTTSAQYVMNTQTGSWCTFTGLNGLAWGLLSENLYFGTSAGTVWRADHTNYDNGGAIRTEVKPAFQAFNNGGHFRVTKARFLYTSGNRISPAVKVDVDYRDSTPVIPTDQYPAYSTPSGSLWGSGVWGIDVWGEIGNPIADWIDASGEGTTAALHAVTSVSGYEVRLNAIDLMYEKTKGLAI